MKKDLVSITDLTKIEIEKIFDLTAKQKSGEILDTPLKGKTLTMIFEKPSLRTRVTFETGMTQLGGSAIYLSPSDIQLGKRERVKDVARNLSRWCDGIMARTFAHETVVELSRHATIPVINGLSDREHPCQALGDLFTLKEKVARKPNHPSPITDLTLAYVGDGNNVCHSLLLLCGILGIQMRVGCPEGYEPDSDILEKARQSNPNTQHPIPSIQVFHDPFEAVEGSDVVYTDAWTSMGQEEEAEERKDAFQRFQVNPQLLSKAKQGAWVMHCLPAHVGEEITEEVLDGPQSIVLDQAENRLHVQKAILTTLLKTSEK
ncbi:ornithine carbamoyltransferase [candidate division TA06 bacterium]|nr:ornithine carbamoyltransferase [candidate division TA06 bacterium]